MAACQEIWYDGGGDPAAERTYRQFAEYRAGAADSVGRQRGRRSDADIRVEEEKVADVRVDQEKEGSALKDRAKPELLRKENSQQHRKKRKTMKIVYHETSRTFHLYNDSISYIMQVMRKGHLGQHYFGKRIRDK